MRRSIGSITGRPRKPDRPHLLPGETKWQRRDDARTPAASPDRTASRSASSPAIRRAPIRCRATRYGPRMARSDRGAEFPRPTDRRDAGGSSNRARPASSKDRAFCRFPTVRILGDGVRFHLQIPCRTASVAVDVPNPGRRAASTCIAFRPIAGSSSAPRGLSQAPDLAPLGGSAGRVSSGWRAER